MGNQEWDLEAWSKKPFGSQAEMINAMSDPRYSHYSLGDEYRAAVMAKAAISFNSAIGIIGETRNEDGVYSFDAQAVGIVSDTNGDVGETLQEEVDDEYQQALAELERLYGPQAVRRETLGDQGNAKPTKSA